MSNNWPIVPLGHLLQRKKDEVLIQDLETYKRLTIHMNGGGISIRDEVLGNAIGTKLQFVVKAGQLVLSKIDARNGAFGIVPINGDGAIITGNFWAFDVDAELLEAKFFDYFTKTPLFIDFCIRASDGTTNRLYLQEPKFLAQGIPLPPVEEQRCIVARIEELAAKIEEARGLRREAVENARASLPSIVNQALRKYQKNTEEVTLESVSLSITDGDHQPPPKADSGVPFIFISNVVSGKLDLSNCLWVPFDYYSSLSSQRVPRRGDILYTAVGSYGVPCLVNIDEPFCFQRHIAIIKPNPQLVLSEYLVWALSSTDVFEQATKEATGSAQLTVPLRGIRGLRFILPSRSGQRKIVDYLDNIKVKIDAIKRIQAETSVELDALLPSVLDKAFKGEL